MLVTDLEDLQPKKKDCRDWASQFPHDRIPVLADDGERLFRFVGGRYFPSFVLLDEDMVVLTDPTVSALSLISSEFGD